MAAVAGAVAGQALLGPVVGVGGLTLAGGAAAMGMFNCPAARPCRVNILDSWIYTSVNVPDHQRLSSTYQGQRKGSMSNYWEVSQETDY